MPSDRKLEVLRWSHAINNLLLGLRQFVFGISIKSLQVKSNGILPMALFYFHGFLQRACGCRQLASHRLPTERDRHNDQVTLDQVEHIVL